MSQIIDSEWLAKHPNALIPKVRQVGRHRTKGYAAMPGTGPSGETCRSCRNYAHNRGSEGRSNPYPKCWLMRTIWSNGPGTDIQARSPACEKWQDKINGKTCEQIAEKEWHDKVIANLKSQS